MFLDEYSFFITGNLNFTIFRIKIIYFVKSRKRNKKTKRKKKTIIPIKLNNS